MFISVGEKSIKFVVGVLQPFVKSVMPLCGFHLYWVIYGI